mgnify:CR=1 FL=1
MNNTKKSRKTFRMSEDLKDILKCVLIWGIILIFASYLLADAEILGNVKQQERPVRHSMMTLTDIIAGLRALHLMIIPR